MKVNSKSHNAEFTPLEISFTLETEKEAKRFYALVNANTLVDWIFGDTHAATLRGQIAEHVRLSDPGFDFSDRSNRDTVHELWREIRARVARGYNVF